jgi:hypothetical protein
MRIDSKRWRTLDGLCAVAVSATLLVGCNPASNDKPRTLPPATATSTPTTTADALEAELVRVYQGYRDAIPSAERVTGVERQAILMQWLTEPLLTRVLDRMAATQAGGRRTYGTVTFEPVDVSQKGSTARLHICQDGSRAGVEEIKTGKKLGHGLPNTPYVYTFRRASDGTWRISDGVSPKGSC